MVLAALTVKLLLLLLLWSHVSASPENFGFFRLFQSLFYVFHDQMHTGLPGFWSPPADVLSQ